MSTIAKVFVVLNLVLAVAFLGAAATFLGYVDSYRGKFTVEETAHAQTRVTKDREINSLKADIEKLQGDVARAQEERTTAVDREGVTARTYNELKAAYDSTAASLATAQNALRTSTEFNRHLSELKDQFQKNAQASLEAANAANDEKSLAVKSMNQAQLDLQGANERIRELEQKLAACEDSLARAEFAAAARVRGGGGTGPGEPQPAQTAKVMAADAGSNIVVISLGSEDGVKVGYRYVVSRGASYVGTIEVTSTEGKQSAARSIRDLQKSEIRVGDDVASR
jgi:hypothetical protein